MADTFGQRLKHAWNAFTSQERPESTYGLGPSYAIRPDHTRLSYGNERSIVSTLYNRIAIDVSALTFRHVRIDQNGSFVETIESAFNDCLNVSANIDQTGTAFLLDSVLSLLDEGVIALVPVDTTLNPKISGSYDIQTIRVGKIVEWFPTAVRVEVYNEKSGNKERVILPKSMLAIVENPLYAVINEPNSTLKRLIHKLNLLDAVDDQSSSGKLDIIIQLPYTIKSDAMQAKAEKRRQSIESQLKGSKYGIAYADATEHITQLNRPAENNLWQQIKDLTAMLYSQLGITEDVFTGAANEETMLNYYNRTIEPIASAISEAMARSFITKTGRTQGQTVTYFRDPFKLVPVSQIADISDKFSRNAILSANEIRAILGFQPSSDPEADKLSNKNMPSTQGASPGLDQPDSTQPDDQGDQDEV